MTSPIASHTKKRIQVSSGSPSIKREQAAIEIQGVTGDQGTRNPRFRPGCVLRRMSTPAERRKKGQQLQILLDVVKMVRLSRGNEQNVAGLHVHVAFHGAEASAP
jgi:hypothetical protein